MPFSEFESVNGFENSRAFAKEKFAAFQPQFGKGWSLAGLEALDLKTMSKPLPNELT